MSRHFIVAGLGAFVLFSFVARSQAELATTINNGDFEAATFVGYYSVDPGQRPGWTAHGAAGAYDYGVGVWDQTNMHNVGAIPALAGVPAYSGYAGGFITVPNLHGANTGAIAAMSQSLGTVAAGDVGKEFQLSADFGARGFATHQWDATMSISFTDSLATFAALGTAGVYDVATPLSNTPVGMETRTATYTPSAGDVGKELFVVLQVVSETPFTVDQQQHFVDNVGISVVPEPSSIALAGIALIGLIVGRRGKSAVGNSRSC